MYVRRKFIGYIAKRHLHFLSLTSYIKYELIIDTNLLEIIDE